MPSEIENILHFSSNYETMANTALTKLSKKDSKTPDKKSSVIKLAQKLMVRADSSNELQQVYRDLEELGFKQMRVNDAIGDAQLAGKDTDSLRKERNDLEEKVLELRQKRDQLEQQAASNMQEQGAESMGPMDSPWGEFGAGAADD